jgi:hypothetical protein
MHRYWGDNYNQLLTIKVIILYIVIFSWKTVLNPNVQSCDLLMICFVLQAYWDPDNVFNFCQSVGSTDNMCCPFTLARPQGPPPSRP